MSFLKIHSKRAKLSHHLRERIQRHGQNINGELLWAEWEDDILRRHYSDFSTMRNLLPHRSNKAISHRGVQLGVARSSTKWTDAECSKLRHMYGSASREELLCAFPNASWKRIEKRASKMGLRRPRKAYLKTGDVPNDSIRDRCFDMKITLVGLNEDCRTKRHFQKRKFGKYHPPYRAIHKATKVLGGTIKLKWARDDCT